MIMSGLLSSLGFVLVAAKFSPNFLKKILGYDYVVDAVITIGLPVFMAGTYSGIMAGVVTGLCMSVVLYVAKNTYGYMKYEKVDGKRQWKEYDAPWSLRFIGRRVHESFNKSRGYGAELMEGWKEASNDAQAA